MKNGAKKTLKKKVEDDLIVERSSGNVFADLGLPNAGEHQPRPHHQPRTRRACHGTGQAQRGQHAGGHREDVRVDDDVVRREAGLGAQTSPVSSSRERTPPS